jgi:hypothetical protein
VVGDHDRREAEPAYVVHLQVIGEVLAIDLSARIGKLRKLL